ncbi:MAG: deoxyguanosinetriphosphate triphosphohydrolase [Nitrospinota bacterium]|nr:MAG: deoxyguanosinetriphosphate triphosphohydrolase [Nitrospinota bacterium]
MSRKALEEREQKFLAPYAMTSAASRGRTYAEEEHPFRLAFQRDRDRIIHSQAFRRLEYKTQVFVNHEGDHYRTRLTHSLEVAQIARTLARALALNEDLAEAIALAHDLGHTPFGHAGERTLNALMQDYGGFEHNIQSLRIVEVLEQKYPHFPGLNLTWETREGLNKHSPRYFDLDSGEERQPCHPTLEAQIVDVADEIAYNSHDLDDGLASGMIRAEALEEVTLWREAVAAARKIAPDAGPKMQRHQAVRWIINTLVEDLCQQVETNIVTHQVHSVEDVRRCSQRLVTFSPALEAQNRELKEFLYHHLYKHYRVIRMAEKAQRILQALFESYIQNPQQLPPPVAQRLQQEELHRVVCDYLAGMTDRFALDEYKKLFDPYERV